MNCTSWVCKACGAGNHILDDICTNCKSKYGERDSTTCPYPSITCNDCRQRELLIPECCSVGFHPPDELYGYAINDRRAAKERIDQEFADFRREHQ